MPTSEGGGQLRYYIEFIQKYIGITVQIVPSVELLMTLLNSGGIMNSIFRSEKMSSEL